MVVRGSIIIKAEEFFTKSIEQIFIDHELDMNLSDIKEIRYRKGAPNVVIETS